VEGKVLYIAKCSAFFSTAIVLLSLSFQVINFSSRLDRWENNLSNSLKERDKQIASVLTSVSKLTKDGSDLVSDSYWDNKASTETTAVILRDVAEITRQVREEIIPQTSSLIYDTNLLLVEAKSLVKDLDEEAKTLGPEVAQTTGALTKLLNTLDLEIKSGSPKVLQTLETLNKTMADLDTIIDGDGRKTITNIEKLSGHSAEISESVDTALKPLRQKRSLLKTIVGIMIGMVRVNVNGF
jgi:ABC-type transporter Mla subunit MlaD